MALPVVSKKRAYYLSIDKGSVLPVVDREKAANVQEFRVVN